MAQPRRTAVQLVGVLLIVALVATVGGLLTGLNADEASPSDEARVELTRLGSERRSATFEARYLVQLPDVESGRLRMVVWQDGSRFRHELSLSLPDGNEHLSVISDGQQRVRCTLRDGSSWQCEDDGTGSQSEVDVLLTGVLESLTGELEARSTVIDGLPVRCFTGALSGTDEVCLDDQGLIVRASTRTATLELVEHRFDVHDVVFVPPAQK